jgi:DNA-binding NarL/FixJ family response regulator
VKTLRILVADDHEVVREGVRGLVQTRPDWTVCGEATNGREAVEQAGRLAPDVVILDIAMPELNGLEAARRIRKASPRTEVLILTMHRSEELVRQVLAAGARGYLLKSDAGRDLLAAVDAVADHRPFLTPRVAEQVVRGYLAGDAAASEHGPYESELTAREREIVQLLAEGKSNKEIGARLDIQTKTVETHRANVMRKLGLHGLSDLVRYAIRNRIVEP